jgi:AcrR family transcriptional regulator
MKMYQSRPPLQLGVAFRFDRAQYRHDRAGERPATPMTNRPKRPGRKKPQVRGEPVIQSVLSITLDELARVGFAALRVEDVAQRARVNKTTVYRRWPTRAALVRAALLTIAGDDIRAADTGSLRGDLVQIGHQIVGIATSPQGQSVIRMILAEGPESELRAIAQSLRESYEPLRRIVVGNALARGEVSTMEQGLLLLELLDAAIHFRLFVSQVGVDATSIEQLAELLSRSGRDGPAAPARGRAGARRPARTAQAARARRPAGPRRS